MSNLTSWKLGTTEIGKSCGSNSGSKFRVYIAKILPLISFGSPSAKSVTLNKGCFCNANACKPSISSNVSTRNYIEIPLADNTHIHSATNGKLLKIEVLSGNIDKMYIVSKIK